MIEAEVTAGGAEHLEGGLRCQGKKKNGKPGKPLVTLITVVFNGKKHLPEAMTSVLSQDYVNIEYIIIDGSSTDGTIDLIREREQHIDYWLSEPDRGIYDAMNKGIRFSLGDVIGFLNADDVLYPGAIRKVVELLGDNPSEKYTCGAVDLIDESGSAFGSSVPLANDLRESRQYLEMPCPHLSVFVGSNVFKNIGLFDTSFQLRADYDFMLRVANNRVPCVELPFVVGCFRAGGASGGMETWKETRDVLLKHGVPGWYVQYVFIRSLTRSSLNKVLPFGVVRFLKKFLVSKNTYTSKGGLR